jgi:hypothetical protein
LFLQHSLPCFFATHVLLVAARGWKRSVRSHRTDPIVAGMSWGRRRCDDVAEARNLVTKFCNEEEEKEERYREKMH